MIPQNVQGPGFEIWWSHVDLNRDGQVAPDEIGQPRGNFAAVSRDDAARFLVQNEADMTAVERAEERVRNARNWIEEGQGISYPLLALGGPTLGYMSGIYFGVMLKIFKALSMSVPTFAAIFAGVSLVWVILTKAFSTTFNRVDDAQMQIRTRKLETAKNELQQHLKKANLIVAHEARRRDRRRTSRPPTPPVPPTENRRYQVPRTPAPGPWREPLWNRWETARPFPQ